MYVPVAVSSVVEKLRRTVSPVPTLPCVITTETVATPSPSKTVYDVSANPTTSSMCVGGGGGTRGERERERERVTDTQTINKKWRMDLKIHSSRSSSSIDTVV